MSAPFIIIVVIVIVIVIIVVIVVVVVFVCTLSHSSNINLFNLCDLTTLRPAYCPPTPMSNPTISTLSAYRLTPTSPTSCTRTRLSIPSIRLQFRAIILIQLSLQDVFEEFPAQKGADGRDDEEADEDDEAWFHDFSGWP